MTYSPWSAKPLPLPSNSRPEPIECRKVVVRNFNSTHVARMATQGSGYRICVGTRAGDRQCLLSLNRRPSVYPGRNPPAFISGFGRAIQHLRKSARGLRIGLQHYLFPPAPTGLVAFSDGHRDSERKFVNVRKGVGEIQNV